MFLTIFNLDVEKNWFKNYFCPEVKKYLRGNNFSNKALLIFDNALGHLVDLSELFIRCGD